MRCMGYCRPMAVEASHLWLAISILATLALTTASLGAAFAKLGLAFPLLALEGLSMVLTYVALLLLYYLFWGSQRLRPLHVAWSFSTVTRAYRRRFHDPEIQQKDMQ